MEVSDYRKGSFVERFEPFMGARRSLGWYRIESLEPDRINGYPKQEFEPILISNYNLDKLGFNVNGPRPTNYVIDLEMSRPNTYSVYFNDEVVCDDAHFIHEIQNIYLKLTRMELVVS